MHQWVRIYDRDNGHMDIRHINFHLITVLTVLRKLDRNRKKLECGPMPNVMVTLPNIGGALCSTPQSLAHAHYQNAVH